MRLGPYYVELHYGTVLETLPLLLSAFTRVRGKLGRMASPKNGPSPRNREEKSLRHFAMVAKFLDDNKPKKSLTKWIRTFSNFIDLI